MIDLFAYVPCKHIKATLGSLINEKFNSLGIRKITYEIETHPYKDPGLYNENSIIYHLHYKKYQPQKYLVMLDESWDGSPKADVIKKKIRNELLNARIPEDDFSVVIIQPELEQWVWTKKPTHLAKLFNTNVEEIKELAKTYGYYFTEKPNNPKELFQEMLKHFKIQHSSDCFKILVQNCSFESCTDKSFQTLKTTLRCWFPTDKKYIK